LAWQHQDYQQGEPNQAAEQDAHPEILVGTLAVFGVISVGMRCVQRQVRGLYLDKCFVVLTTVVSSHRQANEPS
jgi:hypothetical protein